MAEKWVLNYRVYDSWKKFEFVSDNQGDLYHKAMMLALESHTKDSIINNHSAKDFRQCDCWYLTQIKGLK